MKNLYLSLGLFFSFALRSLAQQTTCPAPNPGDPNCFQTSRPDQGNPLVNHPPIPNQDCCNAIPLCQAVNVIDNGTVIPEGAPVGTLYPGCVQNELPPDANTCFSNNEKGTTWYKFQIRPLPDGPTAPGSPAGKLRFRIIPNDVLDDPDYDPFNDDGATSYGNTDYDFLLFKIPANANSDASACTAIRNSATFTNPASVIASCNWTGTRGPTGLFEPGTGTEFAQGPATRFNRPLNVKVGDLFYLAIDNFSVNVQGFTVDFTGLEEGDSTAIVTPPATDTIRFSTAVSPECAETKFVMTFDKPVRCDSVKTTKFTILGAPGTTMVSIEPQGGCNPGGQDTAFVFTVTPFIPGTTFSILVTDNILDICGNKVFADTAIFRIRPLEPLVFNIIGDQPSCGITKIKIEFPSPIRVDSMKTGKFKVLNDGQPLGQVTKIERANGLPMTPGAFDTLFVLTFSKAIKDSIRLRLALVGTVLDKCGNPVELDSLRFVINPFLRVKADPPVACPRRPITLTAILDSTFKNYSPDSLSYRWTNLNNGEQLVEDDSTIFGANPGIVRITRDLVAPENVTYRIVVRNLLNGCLDTAEVPVRFSPRPNIEAPGTLTWCFGDTALFKPLWTNAKPKEIRYSWFRQGAAGDTLSLDSVFRFVVTDTVLTRGLEQNFVLQARYLDSLGGCVARPTDVKMRFGRQIIPVIDLDSALRIASITPAEFSFGNKTTFKPAKSAGRFDWNFGIPTSQQTQEGAPQSVRYIFTEPSPSYKVSLTAFDSVFATATVVGKVCRKTDEIEVSVQNLLPSLVTADGNGDNDNFYIKGMRANTFSMKLYNRWGKLVAEQDPFEVEGWDPRDKVSPGIYYYILTEKRSGKTLVSWLTITQEK
jgi:hypothetical protein